MSSITDFDFIMGAILGQKAESPPLMAFANDDISDVGVIIALTDRSIDRLRCKDKAFTPPIDEALSQGYQNLIRVFNAFVETKIADGDPIHRDWQNKITKAEFDEHRLVDYHPHARNQASTPAPAPTTSSSSAGLSSAYAPKARDPVLEFKKGIKRDPSSIAILKDNKQWDSVCRTLTAQAEYQDVADIIDPLCKPKSQEDIELFAEK
jgi:hypothetical protein